MDTLCLYNLLKVKLGSWPSHDGITEWRMPSFQLSVSYLDSVHMCAAYVIAKFFQGGYRTKMKIWSENFSRASGVQKKGFPNFLPAAAFFRRGGTENR